MPGEKTYIAIDLKSFYASVECVERGLDPLDTYLVVADVSRTEKTICLAVTPALKAYGIPGRARLFEAIERINEINALRLSQAPGRVFSFETFSDSELKDSPNAKLAYIAAPPQMKKYMQVSSRIYNIYMRFVAPEDVHVYSIDEVFIDATEYLELYNMGAEEFARALIAEVYAGTGITATAGIGTNLYLAKIAMDIEAKHMQPDSYGARVASLDEKTYRQKLWDHKPITDFWRVGRGYSERLAAVGIHTMGDIAECSLADEDMFYKMFGVNAELLIDHAWGREPVGMADIKEYEPDTHSLSSGQVLKCPYPFDKAKTVCKEMADSLAFELAEKRLTSDQITLTVCYDALSPAQQGIKKEMKADRYGRTVPKQDHGSANLGAFTSSSKIIMQKTAELFDRIALPELCVRRINLTVNHLKPVGAEPQPEYEQLSLFDEADFEKKKQEEKMLKKEQAIQSAVIELRDRYGKNAVLKALDFEEGATAIERNSQVGGHKA